MNEADDRTEGIPRRIWILWYQGVAEAPLVVRKCIASWQRQNPAWEVVVLDAGNLAEFVELSVPETILARLSLAHRSDLVRLALLSRYGGVWADATTYCRQPLDSWIDDHCVSGLFLFHKPGRDRLIANWFIAAEQGEPLISALYARLSEYWVRNDFPKPGFIRRAVAGVIGKLLGRNLTRTRYWFSPTITNTFGIYPYFVFHYMFADLVLSDGESAAIWARTKKVSAAAPSFAQRSGLLSSPTSAIKVRIRDSDAPMFKLNWKHDPEQYSPDTLLYHILEELPER